MIRAVAERGELAPQGTKPPSEPASKWKAVLIGIALSLLVEFGLALGAEYVLHCIWSLQAEAESRARVHAGVVASPSALAKGGPIYVVQLGRHDAPYSLDEVVASLRKKYGLDIEILKPLELDASTRNGERGKYITQLLMDQIGRAHPDLGARPDATIIGVTDAPVINVSSALPENITARSGQFAIVSTHLLRDPWWRQASLANDAIASRMRSVLIRTLLRDIAMLHSHLPLNFDGTSLLFGSFDPDIPAEDIFESDLDPARSGSGQWFVDPCVVVTYSAAKGMEHDPASAVQECNRLDENETDDSVETFRLYLQNGLLEDRHLDLYQKGAIPIRFGRTLAANWDSRSAFGRSGNDDYDRYLVTTDKMRNISITDVDHLVTMRRVPAWLEIIQWNHWVDRDASGSERRMDWHGDKMRFLVRRYDGEQEWYLPCDDSTLCYLDSIEDGRGHSLQMGRSADQRKLVRISANDGRWVDVKHDGAGHIAAVVDNLGQGVSYGYNSAGQLESAQYSRGETLRYVYDGSGHVTEFRASHSNDVSGVEQAASEMKLTYDPVQGHLTSQEFADGTKRTFTYSVDDQGQIDSVRIQMGDQLYELAIGTDGSRLRELSSASH